MREKERTHSRTYPYLCIRPGTTVSTESWCLLGRRRMPMHDAAVDPPPRRNGIIWMQVQGTRYQVQVQPRIECHPDNYNGHTHRQIYCRLCDTHGFQIGLATLPGVVDVVWRVQECTEV